MALTREEEKAFFLLMGISGSGVNPGDEDSLKKAFRSKAKKAHPDLAVRLGKDPFLMQQHFQELNDAFNILMERLQKEPQHPHRDCARASSKPKTSTSAAGEKTAAKDSAFRSNRKKDEGDFFFRGRTPTRNLRFAEYLYYSGTITWTDLVQALVWQYRHRPKIGELAARSGLLAFDEVLDVIRGKNQGELFGEAAVRLGYLNRITLNTLVREQKKLGLPIGHYFINSRKMTQDVLYQKLSENRRHNIIFDERSGS